MWQLCQGNRKLPMHFIQGGLQYYDTLFVFVLQMKNIKERFEQIKIFYLFYLIYHSSQRLRLHLLFQIHT